MRTLLNVQQISKKVTLPKERTILQEVSFTLQEKEIFVLLGQSGAGKSTLIKIIAGLTPAQGGKIYWQRENLAQFSLARWKKYRQEVQIVWQDVWSALNSYMTVEEIITEPLKVHNLTGDIGKLMDLVGLEKELCKRYPKELSGGQCRRVNLARALALQPSLLLCDEITSGLDGKLQQNVLDLLKKLREQFNLSCLLITHDLDVAEYIADRVAILEKGKIVEIGKTEEIFAAPKHAYTKQLFSSRLI